MNQRILIVDDDANMRRVLMLLLDSQGYSTSSAGSAAEAMARVADWRPHMVLTDLRMPGTDGIGLLAWIQARRPGLPVALLTAHGTIPDAIQATRGGAVDVLVKPVGRERLLRCIQQHLGSPEATTPWQVLFPTRSPRMLATLELARTVARTEAAVLITGASGTGKELMARGIHAASRRAGRPFVAVNCAALPAELLESELFGHARGSFTGAVADHPGLFRAATGGTVFLDEIGDMPAPLQAKLLRVLQEREVRPVGGTQSIPVDVRIVSATHRDLNERIAAGQFRSDLYYRLHVASIEMPPLRERREDVPVLVSRCIAALIAAGSPVRHVTPEALELLAGMTWPGNVRQLFNVVEQAVALAPGRAIDGELVRRCLGTQCATMPSFDAARMEFTREYLNEVLETATGNITHAARLAGRNRTDFYKLLTRHGLEPGSFKRAPS